VGFGGIILIEVICARELTKVRNKTNKKINQQKVFGFIFDSFAKFLKGSVPNSLLKIIDWQVEFVKKKRQKLKIKNRVYERGI